MTFTFKSRATLALQYATPPEVVDETIRASGFELGAEYPAEPLRREEKVYASPDRQTVVRYAKDQYVKIDVITIQAQSGKVVDQTVARLREKLEFFEGMELKELADETDLVHRCFGLRALAATLHGGWIGAIESIQGAFKDERLEVRRIALLCCVRMGWPTLAVVVKTAASRETDAELRANMEVVAKDLAETPHGPPRSPW